MIDDALSTEQQENARPAVGRIIAVRGVDAEGYGNAANIELDIEISHRWGPQNVTVFGDDCEGMPTAFHVKIKMGDEARIDWRGGRPKFRVSWIPLALPCPTGARGSGPGPTTDSTLIQI